MSGPMFLSQIPMFPGSRTSVLGHPLQPKGWSPLSGVPYYPPLSKLPLASFEGRPVLVVQTGLDDGLYACGETDRSVDFEIPDVYRGDPTLEGTVIQHMSIFWMVHDCRTHAALAVQPLTSFWEGFVVLANRNRTDATDTWWLAKPPTGPNTYGTALWIGTAAFFPGKSPVQCGLHDPGGPNRAKAHPLSGNKPSSSSPPTVWGKGPLPESNAAFRRLVRVWNCCGAAKSSDTDELHDVSTRFTLPEDSDLPDDTAGMGQAWEALRRLNNPDI